MRIFVNSVDICFMYCVFFFLISMNRTFQKKPAIKTGGKSVQYYLCRLKRKPKKHH